MKELYGNPIMLRQLFAVQTDCLGADQVKGEKVIISLSIIPL